MKRILRDSVYHKEKKEDFHIVGINIGSAARPKVLWVWENDNGESAYREDQGGKRMVRFQYIVEGPAYALSGTVKNCRNQTVPYMLALPVTVYIVDREPKETVLYLSPADGKVETLKL